MMIHRKTGGQLTIAARVHDTVGGNDTYPGDTSWMEVPGTFAASILEECTHASGVVTVGRGAVVMIEMSLILSAGTTITDASFGISVDDADPAAGQYVDGFAVYAGQYRGVSLSTIIRVDGGSNLRMKTRDNGGSSLSLLTEIGSGFSVFGR